MVLTTKIPIKDNQGSIIGVVGICTDGAPAQVLKMYEKVLDKLPYYVIVKDSLLHLKWANRRFLNEDVGKSLKDLLAMHNEKGATDIDFYGEELGKRYRDADATLLSAAQNELDQKGVGPTQIHEGDELHFFKHTNQRRWVHVTKIPIIDRDDSTVKGVQVYFHDIHEDFCFGGMIRRWLSRHLPRAVFSLVRSHRATEDPNPLPGDPKAG